MMALGAGLLLQPELAPAGEGSPPDPAQPWLQTLCLGNDGWWRQRIRVVVRNNSDQPLAGEPLEIKIGKGDGQADLEGTSADALRLSNEAGVELLWAITGPAGQPVRRGPIPSGSVLDPASRMPGTRAVRLFPLV